MSKTKSTIIPHYELLYIVSNKFSEEELKPIMDKVRKLVSGQGGNITFSEEWGKKHLAYPIEHFNHGYYTLLEFDLDGEKLAKINRELKLMNEVLRFQIVKKRVKTVAQMKADQKIAEKIAARETREAKEKEVETEDKKDKKKVDLKELDEKLDKILDTDDLL